MNIIKENIDELNAIVKINIAPADYETQVEKSLKDVSKKISLPGFRPGKVPMGLVKKMHGKSILADELNKILSDNLNKYIIDNQIEILGNPLPKTQNDKVNLDFQKDFSFEFELGLTPHFSVDIGAHHSFDYPQIKVDDEMLETHNNRIRKYYGKPFNPDVSEVTDLIYGDITELNSEENVAENGISIGTHIAIDKISDEETKKNFIGKKANETVVFILKNISANETDLAAMLGIKKENLKFHTDKKFRFTINKIERIELAEINQELFDKVYGEGKINSLEEFRNKATEEIRASFASYSDNKLFKSIVDNFIQNLNINLPDDFLKRWMLNSNEKPVTMEQVNSEYPHFSHNLKWTLIKNKIIRENNISVTKGDIETFAKSMVREQYARYGYYNATDEQLAPGVKKMLENKEEHRRLYEQLYENKIFVLFKNSFTLTPKEIPLKEFFEIN